MSVLVIGAGGHAKVVIATLQALGREAAGVVDDDASLHGTTVLGVPVLGDVARLGEHTGPAVLAIGRNAIRRRLAETFPEAEWATLVHPSAVVHESVRLGAGTVVFAGAVLQPDTHVGAHAIVNTGATVDHDGRIGDYAHLAPGVHLSGDVAVGEGAFLGVAAACLPGTTVGAWTTVGGGGVVVRDLPPHVTAIGVPARPLPTP